MADGVVQVAPDSSGAKIDNTSLTVGANTVMRQRVQLAGAAATELADVRAATPAVSDVGLVTRPIGSVVGTARNKPSLRVDALRKGLRLTGAFNTVASALQTFTPPSIADGTDLLEVRIAILTLSTPTSSMTDILMVRVMNTDTLGGTADFSDSHPDAIGTDSANAVVFDCAASPKDFYLPLPKGLGDAASIRVHTRGVQIAGRAVNYSLRLLTAAEFAEWINSAGADLSALNRWYSINTQGIRSLAVGMNGSSLVGTVVAEVLVGDSVTVPKWQPSYFRVPHGALKASVVNPATNDAYEILLPPGCVAARIRVSAYTSGQCSPIIAASGSAPSPLTMARDGDAHPDWATVVAGVDGGGIARRAAMLSSAPAGTEYGLVVRQAGGVTANAGTNLNTSALALAATQTDGTQKGIVRGGAKGTTTAADITSTASGANHNAGDVILYDAAGNVLVGQKAMVGSVPVVIASDQSAVVITGDVDHDAVNTLKQLQIAGNANPVDVPPTAVSANGDRVREWMDRYGSPVVRRRKIRETYTAVFRLGEAAARLDQTFTHVANTNKQWATLHHTVAASTKEVRLQLCVCWITSAITVAPQGILELRQISAAPATGNPTITPTARRRGGTAAEAVALYLPTTAGTEAGVDKPLAHHVFDEAVSVATAAFAHPQGFGRGGIVLFDASQEDDEAMQPVLPVGVLDGWAVVTRLTGATVMRMTVLMVFTEEIP